MTESAWKLRGGGRKAFCLEIILIQNVPCMVRHCERACEMKRAMKRNEKDSGNVIEK